LLAINGNARLAIADLPADHPVQESLKEIAKAGLRATDLVRQILAFSRPREEKLEIQQLQPLVEEAIKLVRATLPANIEIRSRFSADLPAAAIDATQIHQVLVNLATNSAHAIGDRGGTIDIRLEVCDLRTEDLVLAQGLRTGRYLRLHVGDNGSGMDSATLARIFDPFFTTKPAGQGTGLGLSVVHGIIQSHSGAISVYSDVGRGTVFHLYFPAASQPEVQRIPAQQELAQTREERLMYVDDEEALVLLATRTLTRVGYQVTGFTDAREALREFRNHPTDFDAVVTDMSMPRMSGLEFANEILAIRPDVVVVMTSGYMRPEDQLKAEALGIRDVILKPSTSEQLASSLDRLLQDRRKNTQKYVQTQAKV
jgi:CheY-like chemotaxis protein